MKMIDRLLVQLKNRGISVEYVNDESLKLTGNTKQADEKIMAAVKAFKPELIERLRPRNPDLARFGDVHHPTPPPDRHQCQVVCTKCNGFVWDTEEYAPMCDVMECPWKNIK